MPITAFAGPTAIPVHCQWKAASVPGQTNILLGRSITAHNGVLLLFEAQIAVVECCVTRQSPATCECQPEQQRLYSRLLGLKA